MSEVAAHALTGAVCVDRSGPWVRRAGHPLEVAVHEVDDRLDALPARRQVPEPLPRFVAKLVGEAEAARHDERDVLSGSVMIGVSGVPAAIESPGDDRTTSAS